MKTTQFNNAIAPKNNYRLQFLLTFVLISISTYSQTTVSLPVKHLPQVLPGSWDLTKNCGVASICMIDAFYKNYSAGASDIKSIDDYIVSTWNTYSLSNYNLSAGVTSDMIMAIAKDYFGYKDVIKASGTINDIKNLIYKGFPVIVAVRIGMKSSLSIKGHFMAVVGLDIDNSGTITNIIVNDVGRSTSSGFGDHYRYPLSTFLASWNTQSNSMVVVVPFSITVTNISTTPNPIQQTASITVNARLSNTSVNSSITGDIACALHSLDGTYLGDIQVLKGQTISKGSFKDLCFSKTSISSPPGKYKLYFKIFDGYKWFDLANIETLIVSTTSGSASVNISMGNISTSTANINFSGMLSNDAMLECTNVLTGIKVSYYVAKYSFSYCIKYLSKSNSYKVVVRSKNNIGLYNNYSNSLNFKTI